MKNRFIIVRLILCIVACIPTFSASARLNLNRILSGAVKAVQAATVTDQQMAQYVQQSVAQMDKKNIVLPETDARTQRLRRLTAGITRADGIPLNFKVYKKDELNAFACPDGSVRVYSGLMDAMTDDEVLGVIGHEIGHVMKHHSKKAFQKQLVDGALKDVIASTGGVAAALTDSQLAQLGETFSTAKYSQKQEKEADDCGYDFLKAQGKNPYGMVMAFEKFAQIEAQSGSQPGLIANMFSSHPDTRSRIKAMIKRCLKDGYTRPSE